MLSNPELSRHTMTRVAIALPSSPCLPELMEVDEGAIAQERLLLQTPNFLELINQLFLPPFNYFGRPFLFVQHLGC